MKKLNKLKESLKSKNLDLFFVSNFYSIYYLSGFRGVSPEERESFLVYAGEKLHLIAPRLYQNEAKALENIGLKVHIAPERDELYPLVTSLLNESKSRNVGFEADDLKFSEYLSFQALIKNKNLIPLTELVYKLREIKTEEEISFIRKAQDITYEGFKNIQPLIKPGISGKELAAKLKLAMEEAGAEGESFESIVASGSGSALPHYVTSTKKLQSGEMILFDFGAKYKGYCGDTTRMVFLGKPTDRMVNIYNLVLRAQENAIKNIKASVLKKDAYQFANEVFVENKVEENFTHGLGHGIGLAEHEAPFIRRTGQDALMEGQIFSVEPGLYFEGWGGVRIEDLVVCRKDKVEVLGNYTKDIVVL